MGEGELAYALELVECRMEGVDEVGTLALADGRVVPRGGGIVRR